MSQTSARFWRAWLATVAPTKSRAGGRHDRVTFCRAVAAYATRLRVLERFPEVAYGLGERVAIEHRCEQLEVELRKEPAALRLDEFTVLEEVDLDDAFT